MSRDSGNPPGQEGVSGDTPQSLELQNNASPMGKLRSQAGGNYPSSMPTDDTLQVLASLACQSPNDTISDLENSSQVEKIITLIPISPRYKTQQGMNLPTVTK